MIRPPRSVAITLVLLATLTTTLGCEMQTRVVSEPWWSKLPADPPPDQAGGPRGGMWTIPLERFTGRDRQAHAQSMLTRLQQQAGLRSLWIEDVDGTATLYRGRFADPSAEEARQALHHSRRIRLDDGQPFSDVRLVNLAGGGEPRITDPHDLRQYPGFYTLQVGYFDGEYDGDFRAAAEDAAHRLREDDHDAYFYHGPHRSLVTVGLFSYEEAFVTADDPTAAQAQVDAYAPTIRELQRNFPHNRGNGRSRPQRPPEGQDQAQDQANSFVVRVF
ncbi:hypothetical protein ACERK3_00915 [Phycisphaerales bacterium AB-hyl4]|uniref:Sporulation related protein n=1 Tax=Natronomicrosphaera hydrolytica TaxID=3242702 RepID=A0ABV4U0F1_9BACT